MWHYNYTMPATELYHHGIKGQKWGVRNGPPYPLKRGVGKSAGSSIIKATVSGHASTPKRATPNSVIDHIKDDGRVDVRTFYDKRGWKKLDIHTTDHGNPKEHSFGTRGEHVHEYEWNSDGSLKSKTSRPLNKRERKENDDIV